MLQRFPGGLTFAAIEHVVHEVVAVLVLRAPREREQSLLIDATADIWSTRSALLRRIAAIGSAAVKSGNLRVTGRERALKDRSRRIDRDRHHLRPDVSWQIGGGHRRQQRRIAATPAQDRAPLEIARART